MISAWYACTAKHERRAASSTMADRVIAIGDIHGCSMALDRLLEVIDPTEGDTVVTLGDYVAKGKDSCGVIDRLLEVSRRCQLVPLLGNHDEYLLAFLEGRLSERVWRTLGGDRVLESYGRQEDIPSSHRVFLESCRDVFETDENLFAHACYDPEKPPRDTDSHILRYVKLDADSLPSRHFSGKTAVLGHTAQRDGEIYGSSD